MQKIEMTADTPLSALFRKEHHGELIKIIDNWRSAIVESPVGDALELSSFRFDFDRIRPMEVYMDLAQIIVKNGMRPPMSVLAHYMFTHSNLSKSESTLYGLLRKYKCMCE
jgi:hypothetical protein